jgi:hypothetical protein
VAGVTTLAKNVHLQMSLDSHLVLNVLLRVGLDRSRPAFSRHFAQALHFARSSGRGLLAKCQITTNSYLAAALEYPMFNALCLDFRAVLSSR